MSSVIQLKRATVFSLTDCEVDFIQEPGGSPGTDKEAMTQHGLVWPGSMYSLQESIPSHQTLYNSSRGRLLSPISTQC